MLLCLMASEHCDLIPTQFLRGKRQRERRDLLSPSQIPRWLSQRLMQQERDHTHSSILLISPNERRHDAVFSCGSNRTLCSMDALRCTFR